MTEKSKNYTDEQTTELVEAYTGAGTDNENAEARESVVKEYAYAFAKSTRSIVAKLVREKVYIRKAAVSKSGDKPETKEAICAQLATMFGVTSDQLGGLEKATKKALVTIRASWILLAKDLDDAIEGVEQD